MNTSPLFSVLIANYNNGSFIEEAIASVLAQTYNNWELIIIDDGSIDNSREILKKYIGDEKIKLYTNDRNRGCGYTKRKCVELANGEFCGFLDPDDALTNDALAIMMDLHLKNDDCSLIYSTCYICNDLSEILYIEDRIGAIPEDEDLLANSMKGIAHLSTFKKDKYNRNIGIDASLPSSVDVDLYFKLEEVGKTYFYSEKPLYYFRSNNPNSISIGTEEKVNSSYFFNVISALNAYNRRISQRSPLYLSKKHIYAYSMLDRMHYLLKNRKRTTLIKIIYYCYIYIKCQKYSVRSVYNLLKINNKFRSFAMFIKKKILFDKT